MNIAAVLVATQPEKTNELNDQINNFPWSEVHYVEDSGRMIVTIEGDSSEEDVERLKIIKKLAGVLSADMIEYYFEDEAEKMWESVHKTPVEVPEYLKDDEIEQPPGNSYQKLRRMSNF